MQIDTHEEIIYDYYTQAGHWLFRISNSFQKIAMELEKQVKETPNAHLGMFSFQFSHNHTHFISNTMLEEASYSRI